MSEPSWIIDESALVRLGNSPDAEAWANRIERGLVRICILTLLEVGYSARSGADLATLLAMAPVSAMPVEYSVPGSRTVPWKYTGGWPSADTIACRPSLTC